MTTILCIFLFVLLAGAVFILKKAIDAKEYLEAELEEAKNDSHQFQTELNKANRKLLEFSEIKSLRAATNSLRDELEELEQVIRQANGQESLVTIGFTEFKPEFVDSDSANNALEQVKQKQKALIQEDKAVFKPENLEVSGDAKEGKRLAKDFSNLILRCFESESDILIAKVTYKNYTSSKDKMERAFEQINKLGKKLSIEINTKYLNLKLEELNIYYQYLELKYREAEEQKEIRRQMKEQEAEEKEAAKALKEAQEKEDMFKKALAHAQAEAAKAVGKKHDELEDKISKLMQELSAAQSKTRTISMAQQTKAGYVYIISNIGSFGENVYKVGMTRRLEPQDRVDELGDASVPFYFDVHAFIYSENAPALEAALHRKLEKYRVNKVNDRKEFFRVDLNTIENMVKETHNGKFNLTRIAAAKEFYESGAEAIAPADLKAKPKEASTVSQTQSLFSSTAPKIKPLF